MLAVHLHPAPEFLGAFTGGGIFRDAIALHDLAPVIQNHHVPMVQLNLCPALFKRPYSGHVIIEAYCSLTSLLPVTDLDLRGSRGSGIDRALNIMGDEYGADLDRTIRAKKTD